MNAVIVATFAIFGVFLLFSNLIIAMTFSDVFLEIKLLRRQIDRLRDNFISTNYRRCNCDK